MSASAPSNFNMDRILSYTNGFRVNGVVIDNSGNVVSDEGTDEEEFVTFDENCVIEEIVEALDSPKRTADVKLDELVIDETGAENGGTKGQTTIESVQLVESPLRQASPVAPTEECPDGITPLPKITVVVPEPPQPANLPPPPPPPNPTVVVPKPKPRPKKTATRKVSALNQPPPKARSMPPPPQMPSLQPTQHTAMPRVMPAPIQAPPPPLPIPSLQPAQHKTMPRMVPTSVQQPPPLPRPWPPAGVMLAPPTARATPATPQRHAMKRPAPPPAVLRPSRPPPPPPSNTVYVEDEPPVTDMKIPSLPPSISLEVIRKEKPRPLTVESLVRGNSAITVVKTNGQTNTGEPLVIPVFDSHDSSLVSNLQRMGVRYVIPVANPGQIILGQRVSANTMMPLGNAGRI